MSVVVHLRLIGITHHFVKLTRSPRVYGSVTGLSTDFRVVHASVTFEACGRIQPAIQPETEMSNVPILRQ